LETYETIQINLLQKTLKQIKLETFNHLMNK